MASANEPSKKHKHHRDSKSHKKERSHKHKRSRREDNMIETVDANIEGRTEAKIEDRITTEAPTAASETTNFFAKLLATEAKAPMIGTFHAKPKLLGDSSAAENMNKGDWQCSKCSTTNMKYASQCQKCHAMKRITEYR